MCSSDLAAQERTEQWMDWANYETSISLRGAFLGGMLNEPPWNHPWFVETGRRQITREVGQLEEHFAREGVVVGDEVAGVGRENGIERGQQRGRRARIALAGPLRRISWSPPGCRRLGNEGRQSLPATGALGTHSATFRTGCQNLA